jgi:hypothetical protein
MGWWSLPRTRDTSGRARRAHWSGGRRLEGGCRCPVDLAEEVADGRGRELVLAAGKPDVGVVDAPGLRREGSEAQIAVPPGQVRGRRPHERTGRRGAGGDHRPLPFLHPQAGGLVEGPERNGLPHLRGRPVEPCAGVERQLDLRRPSDGQLEALPTTAGNELRRSEAHDGGERCARAEALELAGEPSGVSPVTSTGVSDHVHRPAHGMTVLVDQRPRWKDDASSVSPLQRPPRRGVGQRLRSVPRTENRLEVRVRSGARRQLEPDHLICEPGLAQPDRDRSAGRELQLDLPQGVGARRGCAAGRHGDSLQRVAFEVVHPTEGIHRPGRRGSGGDGERLLRPGRAPLPVDHREGDLARPGLVEHPGDAAAGASPSAAELPEVGERAAIRRLRCRRVEHHRRPGRHGRRGAERGGGLAGAGWRRAGARRLRSTCRDCHQQAGEQRPSSQIHVPSSAGRVRTRREKAARGPGGGLNSERIRRHTGDVPGP